MPEWNDAKDIDGLSRATSARSGRATSVMSRKAARVRKATRRCSKTGCETRIGDEGTSSSHDLQTLEVRVGPGSIPNLWADVCGFLKPPDSDQFWKYANMGSLVTKYLTRSRMELLLAAENLVLVSGERVMGPENESIGSGDCDLINSEMKPFLLSVVLFLCLVGIFMHILHRVPVESEGLVKGERGAMVIFSHIMSSMRADSVCACVDAWCAGGHMSAGYARRRVSSSCLWDPGAG